MSEPTKKIELSSQQKFENVFYSFLTLWAMIGAVRWYVRLCWYTRRKYNRFAGAPVCIELFGTDPTDSTSILKNYGVSCAFGSLQWKVIGNHVGLRFRLLVSRTAFDYADNILYQHSGQTFEILTGPGCKRGQQLRTPYPQRQARHTHLTERKARLGKTYR